MGALLALAGGGGADGGGGETAARAGLAPRWVRSRSCGIRGSSAAATAAMLCGRRTGLGCSIFSISGLTPGLIIDRSGTLCRFITTSACDPAISSARPRSAAANTRPRLYMSLVSRTCPPNRPSCSGETKLYLPAKPLEISVLSLVSVDRAMPKSMTFGLLTSLLARMILSVEISRWMTPSAWAACIASATLRISVQASSCVSGRCFMLSRRVGPSTNSIAR